MFAKRLKQLRIKNKKTQEEMSNMLGITRQGYGKYENGKAEPDHETLDKIANYFGVSTDYLLGRTDSPNPDISIVYDGGPKYEDEDEREFIEQQLEQYRKMKKRMQARLEQDKKD
ncbi:helix-turn-helix domain-containing protein [Shouchella clausii]|uniref:helix-turn-helix domain-containing protein n=1 Tax=Shouchella clausii TaxID=79880 RepID=UPI001C73B1EA|nr:helix-turn-helix transcriptional regulator [Shouchella clausii]MBX0319791.1 helix-turn-helix domain-containing protein [Shouchella clausii]